MDLKLKKYPKWIKKLKIAEVNIAAKELVIEVISGPDQSFELNNPELLDKLQPTGTDIEGYSLYAIKANNEILFALKDKDFISMLVGKELNNFPTLKERGAIEIQQSYTPEQYRRKGFSIALYNGLSKLGYAVVSDKQLSNNAQGLWHKLGSVCTLKTYNPDSNEIIDANPNSSTNFRYVLEQKTRNINSILKDSKYFTRGYPNDLE